MLIVSRKVGRKLNANVVGLFESIIPFLSNTILFLQNQIRGKIVKRIEHLLIEGEVVTCT